MRKLLVICSAFALVGLCSAHAGERKGPARPEKKTDTININGDWTAVYVELDGKAVDLKKFTNIKIKDNIITCLHDGNLRTYRMDFGPHHTIRCTEENAAITQPTEKRVAHTHHGVYIASHNYLCFNMNKGVDKRFAPTAEKRAPDKTPVFNRWESQGPVGADFVIVLRRTGAVIAGQ
jgi:hypothetical protein